MLRCVSFSQLVGHSLARSLKQKANWNTAKSLLFVPKLVNRLQMLIQQQQQQQPVGGFIFYPLPFPFRRLSNSVFIHEETYLSAHSLC